ncbi:DNA-3-methyladenine glycosylase 2 [Rhodobacteraceae bacterium THAF1]|uniref:DNA-3-methyladenine glycosylase family protein n=1 Tax=Palleronia sp. THAF1 TaxID=2587842 RepID=UPI000F3CA603|nr:helix-hairpin-helix domain-containing protein [Palleronia sp. THAF1]QFU09197.1 DNA-3-methyladenine glycosylase 2 [Palleronia sp. THAF1]VDC27304.1 DNA-3-methyladenine glycosylase 2 [Rhodobacteraceae bacterium THAF1]
MSGPERILRGPACIEEGAVWLGARDPAMARARVDTGPWPDRLRNGGFPALVQAIVSQQVSVASAKAIGARVEAAGYHAPDAVLAATEDELRSVGLSRPKARYVRALAEAGIDFDALQDAPSDHVVDTLVAVPGIGRWTAEIYALFSLGRADVFPAGDLALQEAARMLYGLDTRPSEKALREMAETWRPWRGVAARGLWAWYAVAKAREGVV